MTLKQSMIDTKMDEKETQELKNLHNHYVDKGTDITKNTQCKVEDGFVDILNRESSSPEQKTKFNNFFGQNVVKISNSINITLFKPRNEKNEKV